MNPLNKYDPVKNCIAIMIGILAFLLSPFWAGLPLQWVFGHDPYAPEYYDPIVITYINPPEKDPTDDLAGDWFLGIGLGVSLTLVLILPHIFDGGDEFKDNQKFRPFNIIEQTGKMNREGIWLKIPVFSFSL